MAITDLLRSVPIPLPARWRTASDDATNASPEPIPTFGDGRSEPAPFLTLGSTGTNPPSSPPPHAELPALESLTLDAAEPPPGWSPVPFEEEVSVPWTFPEPPPPAAPTSGAAPQPPAGFGLHRVAALCLGVSVLSALAALTLLSASPPATDAPPPEDAALAVTAATPPEVPGELGGPEPLGRPSTVGTAEPTPIPADMITRLEAAADDSLPVELGHLLGAMNFAFGTDSARLDPALRSYVYRMASRFEWNPDTFRIAVTAPTEPLASARADLIRALFSEAVAARRLVVDSSTGPHALSLVSE